MGRRRAPYPLTAPRRPALLSRSFYFISRHLMRCALAIVLACAGTAYVSADEGGPADFDAGTGYRIARYRSPVPADVPGGTRIGIDEIDQLMQDRGAMLLDVMPSEGAGLNAETGQWATKRHENIPGSTWLPDVGRGRIDDRLARYLSGNLQRLTSGDKTRAIIIYCQSDCWMGWNAVQRIAALGFTSLYWYPDGIDGWRDWDRTFAQAVPTPATDIGP
jgi:PQQ-dependent catabolism-associated CXXCW motif protein